MFEHKHILLVLFGILITIMQWNKTLNSWQIPLLCICSVIKFSYTFIVINSGWYTSIVLPAKSDSDSDIMFCLQSFHGLLVDRQLVY